MTLPTRPDIGRHPEHKMSATNLEVKSCSARRRMSGNVGSVTHYSGLVENSWFALGFCGYHSIPGIWHAYFGFIVRRLEFLMFLSSDNVIVISGADESGMVDN